MNKKLLALAIGAALVPATAAANPTLYGKMNVTLDSVETEFGADTYPAAGKDEFQLNSNASRLGVRGKYDLEVGGLKALYQAEYEIKVDDGAGPFGQRNIFAGLEGGFGTLKAGRFDDPIKISEGKVDQFNDLAGDMDSFVAGQNRPSNIIEYTSPKLADAFSVKVASILAEGTNIDGAAGNEEGLFDNPQVSVAYDKDGLYVALAYGADTAMSTQTVDGFTRGDILRLVATFKAGDLQLGGLFQTASDNATGSSDEDTSMLLSAAYAIDKVTLKAQLGTTEGDVSGDELAMMGIGADYKLAKASKTFLYMTTLEKDSTGQENTVLGLGLEHNF